MDGLAELQYSGTVSRSKREEGKQYEQSVSTSKQ